MDAIISILFIILLIFVVYLFARILFPFILFFSFAYIIYYYVIRPLFGPRITVIRRTPPKRDYQKGNPNSKYQRTSNSPDVFDAEFETRDLHDDEQG